MMQSYLNQLDLTLYQAQVLIWWHHPVVLAGLIGMGGIGVIGLWWVLRHLRRKQVPVINVAKQLQNVLEQVRAQAKGQQIAPSQGLAVVTCVLKQYTAWLCSEKAVRAMTDQQWLDYIGKQEFFKDALPECQQLMHVAEQVKFNYAVLKLEALIQLIDTSVMMLQSIELVHQNAVKQAHNTQT